MSDTNSTPDRPADWKMDYSTLDNVTGADGVLRTPYANAREREKDRYRKMKQEWAKKFNQSSNDGGGASFNSAAYLEDVEWRKWEGVL